MEHWLEPALGHHEAPAAWIELTGIVLSIIIAIFGVLMAYARYVGHESWADRLTEPFKALAPHAEKKWYVDEFYNMAIVKPILMASEWFAGTMDRLGIDALVNGTGSLSMTVGEYARRLQNGAVPTYAVSILVGVVVVVVYFVFSL
jgi:NADH-quinone oxidoreductase subunit L